MRLCRLVSTKRLDPPKLIHSALNSLAHLNTPFRVSEIVESVHSAHIER